MSAHAEELCFIFENVTTGAKRKFHRPPFPVEMRRKLFTFCECALSLNECSFVKNQLNRKGSIHFGNDGSVTNKGDSPSDDEIGAFLHRLRPIYLNDEETNFNKVGNVLCQHLSHPDVTEAIRYWKQVYDGRDSQKIFAVKIKGKILNSDEFFNNYVNALEYHRNLTRRRHIDLIAERFPLEVQKSMFVLLLRIKLNAINKLASFILAGLQNENGQPIILRDRAFHEANDKPIILPK